MRLLFASLLLVLAISSPARGGEAPPGWLFLDFEKNSGWRTGAFPKRASNIALAQGRARIIEESAGNQVLELRPGEPFAAALIEASPIAGRSVVYCDMRARPFAIGEDRDEEFLDFGGAVLGFFRDGDDAEVCALFGKTDKESVWISSGVRIPLDAEGVSERWIRLGIRLNKAAGRWSLVIDGVETLSGLRTAPRGSPLRLWLYGNDAAAVRFDDVLVTAIPPEEIARSRGFVEGDTASEAVAQPARTSGPQRALQVKSNDTLRETAEPLRKTEGSVHLADWHITLDTGDRTYESSRTDDDSPKIIAYAPPFDADGNRLPVKLTITADAAIEPGADLGKLRWQVRELLGWPNKFGALVAAGDFRTGLVQTVTIAPEWASKATSVHVGMVLD